MIPYVTGRKLKKVDERAESEYGISLQQLMEVAGARMAEFLRSKVADISKKEVIVICGKGNNGGDGLVCARVLNNWGAKVKILLAFPKSAYKGVIKKNLKSCEMLGIEFIRTLEEERPHTIIDCLFGFGFKGRLKKEHLQLVNTMNHSPAKIFACDLPSGMGSTKLNPHQVMVNADCTLTFTVPKEVFKSHLARKRAGDIYILDIGIPRPLYEEMGVDRSFFNKASWVRW